MSAALTYRIRLLAAIALALATLAGGVFLAVPLSMRLRVYPGPVPLAAVSEAEAERAATARPPRLAEAEAATRRTLEVRPMDAAAWSRLAWIAREEGRNPAMLDALDRSYAVAPYGPEVTAWRLRFAFQNWPSLTSELRGQALGELAVTARDRPGVADAASPDITDPAGRLAFTLGRRSPAPASDES